MTPPRLCPAAMMSPATPGTVSITGRPSGVMGRRPAHARTIDACLKAGTISMANAGAGTARADFFILLSDVPAFDAGDPQGDATGFAAFGHVIEGMDVVKKIFDAPVSETKGEGAMKGQMLDPPIKIIKAERVE